MKVRAEWGGPSHLGSHSAGIQASVLSAHPRTLEHSNLGGPAACFLLVHHPSQDTCLTLGLHLSVEQSQRVAAPGPMGKRSLGVFA